LRQSGALKAFDETGMKYHNSSSHLASVLNQRLGIVISAIRAAEKSMHFYEQLSSVIFVATVVSVFPCHLLDKAYSAN
jgi:hypothetical protein